MRARCGLLTLVATLSLGMAWSVGTAVAATVPPANIGAPPAHHPGDHGGGGGHFGVSVDVRTAAVTAVAPRSGPHPGSPQGSDRRPDRHGPDHGAWRGRGWDHRGYGWDWERQCRWADRHDRLWWITHCR